MDWNQLLQPEIIWAVIGLLLMISEFVVPGLVLMFFGLGALLVGLICMSASLSLNAQIVTFIGSSLLMLGSLRQWSLQVLQVGSSRVPLDSPDLDGLLGRRVKVISDILPHEPGKVELYGSDWRASSSDPIATGEFATIIGRDNLTLLVKSNVKSHTTGGPASAY